MSRNKENIAFRTAQRPTGSTLLSRTPQSEDFFTDSLLDASKIPTPSPKKPQAFSVAHRRRHGLGNAKTLKTAWEASARTHRPSSSEDETHDRASSLPRLKSVPTQSQRRNPNTSTRNNDSTTPPDTRLVPEARSPTSDVLSPPPRGLTDVYQRIADEEILAAQEGEMEDEDIGNMEELAPAFDRHALAAQTGPSHSTIPVPSPRMTLGETVRANSQEFGKENLIPEEITSMSEASGLSFYAGMTDQNLAAKLTTHTIDREKDRERLRRIRLDDRPITFQKSRRRQDSWQENGDVADQQLEASSNESVRSEHSEPLPRRPRAFPQAKRGKAILAQRRAEREAELEAAKNHPLPDSSHVDWAAAAADVALPSIEDSSTPKAASSRNSTMASLHKQTSLDRIRQWELNDFTGQSLQVSQSPPVRIRTNTSDQMKDKEIESLAKQAVTTNRLEEIREKDPQQLRRMSRSPSIGASQIAQIIASVPAADDKRLDDNGNGEPIPDTPIVVYRTSNNLEDEENKPKQDINKGHDIMQRLARARSHSPRSGLTSEEWSFIDKDDDSNHAIDLDKYSEKLRAQLEHSQKSSKGVVQTTPEISREVGIAKTPVITGAWTDTILPDSTKSTKVRASRYVQTPHVNAGGWIDTPAGDSRRQSSASALMQLEKVPEELTEGIATEVGEVVPSRAVVVQDLVPKSTLAGLLDEAKRKRASRNVTSVGDSNDTLNLGDATIESLQELLTLDDDDMTTLMRMGAEFEARNQLNGQDGDHDDFLEYLAAQLKRVCANIHDTRKGMSRLEHQVNQPQIEVSNQKEALSPGQICPTCSSIHILSDVKETPWGYKVYLSIPIPKLFHQRQKDLGQWFPRPTLLGGVVLAIWLWYLPEQVMCELYCHPLYAEYYDWPAEPEPVFPYALPTMLYRWSGLKRYGPSLFGPLWMILIALVRIVGQVLGWTDGYVDTPYAYAYSKLANTSMSAASAAAMTGGAQAEQDLSMMSDEYI